MRSLVYGVLQLPPDGCDHLVLTLNWVRRAEASIRLTRATETDPSEVDGC